MRGIVVGLGGWGSTWTQVMRDGGWDVAAWVDVNPGALEHACKNLGADPGKCFGTLDKALANTQADAVFIFTPPMASRAEHIIKGMDAGLHVLAEKPLTTSPDELHAILERHRSSGVKFMVAQNYRWFPGSVHMRQTVAGREMGDLGYMNVFYHMAEHMPDHHMAGVQDALVLGMCVHHLDTMRFVTGTEPERIWAETWNPSWSWSKGDSCANSVLTFPGGVRVAYSAGWVAHRGQTDWFGKWTLEFDGGSMQTDGVRSLVFRGDETREMAGPEINGSHTRADVLREFTAAIKQDREPECSLEDNAKTMLVAFAMIESSRTHQEIDLAAFAREQGLILS